jgi:hypothetical protein
MSRFTDEDLGVAFRLRAVGRPRPGLRQRIRRSTRQAQEPRDVAVIQGMAHRRPILVRLTAVAAIAAVLILAPLVGAGSDVWQRLDLPVGPPTPDQTAAGAIVTAIEDGEDDEGDDDEDEGDDDDEGDDEDGVDEDEVDDDDEGDDEDDPEESEDDS